MAEGVRTWLHVDETAEPTDHEGHDEDRAIPQGKYFTVNSRRLPVRILHLIAGMLEVLARESSDELRQLIEGQLAKIGKDSRNVQIIVEVREADLVVSLVDETGVFNHTTRSCEEISSELGQEDDLRVWYIEVCSELESTKLKLEECNQQLEVASTEYKNHISILEQKLTEIQSSEEQETTIKKLREELAKEKENRKYLWSMSCQQVQEFEMTLDEKDEEISNLKEQLREAKLRIPTDTDT